MSETWKPVVGYEGLYEVSDLGRVRSVDVLVGYNHWRTGARLKRLKKGRMLPTQLINSGYLIVHLHKENRRTAKTVHRLVACAFLGEHPSDDVNHRNGDKTDPRLTNLEWLHRSGNHDHAVDLGLNSRAVQVRCPKSGRLFPSMNRAAKELGVSPKTVRAYFERVLR